MSRQLSHSLKAKGKYVVREGGYAILSSPLAPTAEENGAARSGYKILLSAEKKRRMATAKELGIGRTKK